MFRRLDSHGFLQRYLLLSLVATAIFQSDAFGSLAASLFDFPSAFMQRETSVSQVSSLTSAKSLSPVSIAASRFLLSAITARLKSLVAIAHPLLIFSNAASFCAWPFSLSQSRYCVYFLLPAGVSLSPPAPSRNASQLMKPSLAAFLKSLG